MLQAAINSFKIPDLRRKLVFTLAMLLIFRVVAHIPVPGVDVNALKNLFQNNQLLGMLDLFSGGALKTFSIAMMGVYPYITAQIIMQLITPIIPPLQEMSREGEAGRNRLNQYTHWLTVPLAALQAYGTMSLYHSQGIIKNFSLFHPNTALPTFAMIISATAGTIFLVWLGELITENGIGNGISIIIFGGIVAGLPGQLGQMLSGTSAALSLFVWAVLGVATIAAIVYVQEGQRRIPVHYAKRIRGTRMYGGGSTHVPLRVNSAGMIPLIFAASIMLFPSQIASYFERSGTHWVASFARFTTTTLGPNSPVYWILYFVLVVAFTYFYTMVIFNQQNLPENLQKTGGFIPGIRPGRPTGEYLNRVLYRITLLGAVFLGLVAILPYLARLGTGVTTLQLSSTALLILVGVAVDTMKQLEAQLLMRHYQGFINR